MRFFFHFSVMLIGLLTYSSKVESFPSITDSLGGLGGLGGVTGSAAGSPQRFPVQRTSSTQTFNPRRNRYQVNNQFASQGQTRDADVVGLDLLALPGFLKGLGG